MYDELYSVDPLGSDQETAAIPTDGRIAITAGYLSAGNRVFSDSALCVYSSHRGEIGSSTHNREGPFFSLHNRLQIKSLKTKYYHKTDAFSSFGHHRIDALKTERW